VIVDDSQLSLAIGKKGQNVRLAAKLLGWRIDIKSEEEKRQEIESQMAAMALRGAPITNLAGLGDKTLQRLRDSGIETVEQLAQMTPDQLTEIQGIGEKTVEKIRKVVTDYFEAGQQGSADADEAEQAEASAGETGPATKEESVVEETSLEPGGSDEVSASPFETAPQNVEENSEETAGAAKAGSEATTSQSVNDQTKDETEANSKDKGGTE